MKNQKGFIRSKRESALVWLTDEDFDLIGIKSRTVSNTDFAEIVEEMKEYFDGSFSTALKEAFDNVRMRKEAMKE